MSELKRTGEDFRNGTSRALSRSTGCGSVIWTRAKGAFRATWKSGFRVARRPWKIARTSGIVGYRRRSRWSAPRTSNWPLFSSESRRLPVALDLTGISNVNEFYSHHYLDALLESDLKGLLARWDQAEKEEVG